MGLGHLMRLTALAQALPQEIEKILTGVNVSSFSQTLQLSQTFSTILDLPNGSAELLLEKFSGPGTVFALDGYDVDENYQSRLKQAGQKLILVDDFAQGSFHADVVINHAPGADAAKYQGAGCALVGPRYALIRKEFFQVKPKQKNGALVICLGGEDSLNITRDILQTALGGKFSAVEVVLGAAYRHTSSLEPFLSKSVNIHQNLSAGKLAILFAESSAAVTSASTVSLEAAAVGTALGVGYYTENQYLIYEGLVGAGAAMGLGDLRAQQDLDLLLEGLRTADFSKAQKALFGRGPQVELSEALLPLWGNA